MDIYLSPVDECIIVIANYNFNEMMSMHTSWCRYEYNIHLTFEEYIFIDYWYVTLV
jgi:hypothetical protein